MLILTYIITKSLVALLVLVRGSPFHASSVLLIEKISRIHIGRQSHR